LEFVVLLVICTVAIGTLIVAGIHDDEFGRADDLSGRGTEALAAEIMVPTRVGNRRRAIERVQRLEETSAAVNAALKELIDNPFSPRDLQAQARRLLHETAVTEEDTLVLLEATVEHHPAAGPAVLRRWRKMPAYSHGPAGLKLARLLVQKARIPSAQRELSDAVTPEERFRLLDGALFHAVTPLAVLELASIPWPAAVEAVVTVYLEEMPRTSAPKVVQLLLANPAVDTRTLAQQLITGPSLVAAQEASRRVSPQMLPSNPYLDRDLVRMVQRGYPRQGGYVGWRRHVCDAIERYASGAVIPALEAMMDYDVGWRDDLERVVKTLRSSARIASGGLSIVVDEATGALTVEVDEAQGALSEA